MKNQWIRKTLKGLGIALLSLIGAALLLVLFLTAVEFRPADEEPAFIERSGERAVHAGEQLTAMTWNLGYGALGDNADFFMDGGSSVYTADRDRLDLNMNSIAAQIRQVNPDLCFLQEVDRDSARSLGVDELRLLRDQLPDRSAAFAANFVAPFVPYPLPPIGRVHSGLATLSRAAVNSAVRIQLPVPFAWPLRVANLKRCALVTRCPVLGTDRELVCVNLHLEAYDDGSGKEAQTRQLAALLQQEAEKGNYVIAGGDFNQTFSVVDPSRWTVREGLWTPGILEEAALGEGLALAVDGSVPTCRSLDKPLAGADQADFQFYVIDGFIVSANVQVEQVKTLDLGFRSTDHNPVVMRLTLAP